MRETAAATGTPAEAGAESAEDLDVSSEPTAPEPETPQDAAYGDDEQTHATDLGDRDAGEQDEPEVGEATDEQSPGSGGHSGARNESPAYTRPPGMPPPPNHLDEQAGHTTRFDPAVTAPTGVRLTERDRSAAARLDTDTGSYPTIGTGAPASGSAPDGGTVPAADGAWVRTVDPAAAIGSARVHEAVRATRAASGPRGPRRARLTLKRLDPWSVMKFSFTVSLVLFIVMIVAASVLYLALDTMGVFTSVNNTLADLIESGGGEGEGFRINAQNVIGAAGALGAINVLLFTALATLGAFIYNVCADLVGGVEVTLAERE
jgi:hypothetical protein